MRVFLSWSGQQSRQVAAALRDWLPEVIQRINPWMSSEDISAGERWMNQLSSELEKTSYAVLCLPTLSGHCEERISAQPCRST